MSKTTTVTSASNGVIYTVRLVEKGDHYGLNFCKTHDEDRPMVEFYDVESKAACFDFVGTREDAIAAGASRLGQFVSNYYVSTLMENIATTRGICLNGGVARWVVDGDAVRQAFQALGLWKPVELPYVKLVQDAPNLPFFERTRDIELRDDIKAYFSRVLGPMHALQAAYPGIDVSHLIQSFEAHAGVQSGFRPETLDGYAGPAITATKIVVVFDSQDPDTEPTVWVPRRVAPYWSSLPLNKSQELGGRFPNTDPADITLLEAGSNAAFPDYVQLP